MTMMKRCAALALALTMTAGLLTGCGKKEEGAGSGSQSSSSQTQAPAVEPMSLEGITDPCLAVSGIPGDTVVATVGEYEIPASNLLHWLVNGMQMYMSQMAPLGITDIPWEKAAEESEGGLEKLFLDSALDTAVVYRLVPVIAQREGVTVSQEAKDFLEKDLADTAAQLGGPEGLKLLLWHQLSDEAQYRENFERSALYQLLADHYYGPNSGSYPTDARVQAFAQDELGLYRAKHILLATKDTQTREPLDEATCKEKKAKADDILAQIRSAADPAAKFDELMKANSEDPGLAQAPDGYDAMKGQMVPEFENAAMALKEGEISDVVESDFGYHIIMRLPLKDLEPVRGELVNRLMQKRVDDWLEANPVETTEVFDKIDVKDFWEKVQSFRAGVTKELQAIQDKMKADTDQPEKPQPEKSQAEGK